MAGVGGWGQFFIVPNFFSLPKASKEVTKPHIRSLEFPPPPKALLLWNSLLVLVLVSAHFMMCSVKGPDRDIIFFLLEWDIVFGPMEARQTLKSSPLGGHTLLCKKNDFSQL